tara:strand:- start:272 stop:601 length:330 start_codon:yes stop_codon:yes gene_type:complete
MTPEQLELLAEMIAEKVFNKLKHYIEDKQNGFLAAFDPMSPQEFFDKEVDAFGNIRYTPPRQPSKKELLAGQLHELKIKWAQLLEEEKYELIIELKEIYDKIKKDYDNL